MTKTSVLSLCLLPVLALCLLLAACASTGESGPSTSSSTTTSAAPAKPATLSLAKTELKLVPGQSYWLDAAVPGATWTSEDESVATVTPDAREHADTCSIITVPKSAEPGQSAVITAKAGGKTQTCTVTVVKDLGNFSFSEFRRFCPDYETATTFSIPDGYTSLNRYAFDPILHDITGDPTLKEIKLPDSLMVIENYVFSEIKSLEQVELLAGVTEIGNYAFKSCTALKKITIPESVKRIGSSAFAYCKSLESVTIPKAAGVTEIGNYAFDSCAALKKIDIPKSVKRIGRDAFDRCSSLESIAIPETTTLIDPSFNSCTALKKAEIKGTIELSRDTYEYWQIFPYCTALESIVIASFPATCSLSFEGLSSLKSLTYPKNVIPYSFEGCSSLEAVELPPDLKEIKYGMFQNCASLKTINLPKGIAKIGAGAFEGCSSLKTVNLPEGLQEIISSVFKGCTSLESITIPKSVKKVDTSAFFGCTSLAAINVDEENHSYASDDGVLFSKDMTYLTLFPAGKKGAYTLPPQVQRAYFSDAAGLTKLTMTVDQWYSECDLLNSSGLRSLTQVEFSDSGKTVNRYGEKYTVHSINGCVYEKPLFDEVYGRYGSSHDYDENSWVLRYVPGGVKDGFTIPDFVTHIQASFRDTSLTHIEIPDSVVSTIAISENPFLKKVTIGAGVEYSPNANYNPFWRCENLAEIVVSPKNKSLASKDGVLFTKDMGTLVCFPQGKGGSYTVPDSVTKIGYVAFSENTNLTRITLPKRLKEIGEQAFIGCINLTELTLPNALELIDRTAFSDCAFTEITIPKSVVAVYVDAFSRGSRVPDMERITFEDPTGWRVYDDKTPNGSGPVSMDNPQQNIVTFGARADEYPLRYYGYYAKTRPEKLKKELLEEAARFRDEALRKMLEEE